MKRTFSFPGSIITSITDGDTMRARAQWEQPFYIEPAIYPIALRIAGIDAWPREDVEHRGAECYHRVQELVLARSVTIVTYEQYAYRGPRGTIGEWVGDIYVLHTMVDSGDQLLSKILLAEGLAVPYDGKGKRPSGKAGG